MPYLLVFETAAKGSTSTRPKRDWGPEQATGAPDTPEPGDKTTAWASLTDDGQQEWLLLDCGEPVRANEIHVYESFNPGALSNAIPDGSCLLGSIVDVDRG